MQKIIILLIVLLCSLSALAQDATQGTLYAVGKKVRIWAYVR